MGEHEEAAVKEQEELEEAGAVQNGVVTGITGRKMAVNGVLDLRQVPKEEVSRLESLTVNGVVLLDESNRNALAPVRSKVNGTVMVADADLRLVIEPDIEISRSAVAAMPAGQKLMLIGNVFFKPDVPPEMVAEKFERLYVVGILVACEGVYGALMGKMERTGVSVTLPDDAGSVVRSIGENDWTQEYVSRLADGTAYVNIGVTRIPEGVGVDLVERKIGSYHNVGQTVAPEQVLALLKARCSTNIGQFLTRESEEDEE